MLTLQSQQILLPKQVYIADKAELRCSFTTDSEVIRNETLKSNSINLSKTHFTNDLDYSKYEINTITLTNTGANSYTLTIDFIPWQTGEIVFPDYDIGLALNSNQYMLKFNSIKINSIVEENNVSSIKEISSPLLLPGTTYKIYGIIIAFLVAIILIIRLIIKHKELSFFIQTKILQHKYNKNKKLTIKKLNTINDDNTQSDRNTAANIQQIIRNYLEIRFDYPFTRTVTSDLLNGFYERTNHLIKNEKEDAFIGIANTFIRTDFIRYSDNASFKSDEKNELIQKLIRNIEIIEQPEKKNNA